MHNSSKSINGYTNRKVTILDFYISYTVYRIKGHTVFKCDLEEAAYCLAVYTQGRQTQISEKV